MARKTVVGQTVCSGGCTPHTRLALLCAVLLTGRQTLVHAAPPTGDQSTKVASAAVDPELGDIASSDDDLSAIDLLTLEVPTVVTASRHEQKINLLPYAISVITAEDIWQSGARNVPDALRLVPGMDVADLSYGETAVSPRGFHGFLDRQVLVLVDGRQIYDSMFGGTLWGNWPFQLEDIARIEVIRGPGGVTWGSNAVNGVINIITKDPAEQKGLTVTGGGGSRGTQKEHMGYGFSDGKLRMRVSGEYEGSDGFDKGGSIVRKLDDFYKAGRESVYAVYDATPKDTITLSAGNATVDGSMPTTPLAGLDMSRRSGTVATFALGKWAHKIAEDNRLELTGYLNDFDVSAGAKQIDYRYDQFALQLSHTFKPAEQHTITWGVDTRTDYLDASASWPQMCTADYFSTATLGAYVQDDWAFAPKWTLSLGGRVDYECYNGFQPSARAALAYAPNDQMTFYGSVSRAVQIPTPGFRFFEIPFLNGLASATKGGKPEVAKMIAYELGYRGSALSNRLQTSAAVFWQEYADESAFAPTLGPPGLLTLRYGRRGDASLYGVEADATFKATEKLTLLANYTYEQLDWRASVPFNCKDLITPPTNKFMLGVNYKPAERWNLSSYLYYVGTTRGPNATLPLLSVRIPQYFRWDVRAEYEFWKDRGSVAVGVRNLLQANHLEGTTAFMSTAEVPRMVYAEMRMNFK